MKKIKVLQFAVGSMMGGQTRYILNNWEYISKDKFEFDFITFREKFAFRKELEAQGCNVFYISCYPRDDMDKFKREFNNILSNNYDVIHIHTNEWSGMEVEELAKEYGVPKIIIHSHNTSVAKALDRESELEKIKLHNSFKQKLSLDIADEFLSCSKAAADWLYGDRIPEDKVTVVNNAIDVEKYLYSEKVREEVRNELGLDDKFVIGNIGRLAYQKNQLFLVDIMRKIVEVIPNSALVIVGDGVERENLQEKIKEYNLEKNVFLLGQRSDVNRILQAMDVFCFPSLFEGLGIVAIEAQSAGVYCLLSENVPQEACITENVEYLKLDLDIWINKIIEIYNNGYERKNTYNEITDKGYNIKKQIKVLEDIYSKYLKI